MTRIKRRFVTDPDTYKQFLDILHTYQKQQRSIKDVLEKVSKLFRNHPDLLRDFTYFLPDAVQGQVEAILRQNKVCVCVSACVPVQLHKWRALATFRVQTPIPQFSRVFSAAARVLRLVPGSCHAGWQVQGPRAQGRP